MLNHETKGSLLQLVSRLELSEVVESRVNLVLGFGLVGTNRLRDPWMIQSLLCRHSLVWIKSEHLNDKILGFVSNLIEYSSFNSKIAVLNSIEDLNI